MDWNVVAWQNDAFSYIAELAHPGRFWNLPTVHIAHGLAEQEAINRTVCEADNEIAAFQRRVQTRYPEFSAAQRSHVASLKSWMRGCYDWHIEATGHYIGWTLPDT